MAQLSHLLGPSLSNRQHYNNVYYCGGLQHNEGPVVEFKSGLRSKRGSLLCIYFSGGLKVLLYCRKLIKTNNKIIPLSY